MSFEYYVGWNMDCYCNINKQHCPVDPDDPDDSDDGIYDSYSDYKYKTGRYYEHEIAEDCTFRTFMNKLCKVSKSFSYYRLSSDYVLSGIFDLEIFYNVEYHDIPNKYDKLCKMKCWNENYRNTISDHMKEEKYTRGYNDLNFLFCILSKIPNISKIKLYHINEDERYPILDQLNRLFLMLQNNNKLWISDIRYVSLFNDNENFFTEQLMIAKNNIRFYSENYIYEKHIQKRIRILKEKFRYR